MTSLTKLRLASMVRITTLADGTFACWHPERRFPYEHSRPIEPQALADDREVR